MTKTVSLKVAIVAALALAMVALVGCSGGSSSSTSATSSSTSATSSSAAASSSAEATSSSAATEAAAEDPTPDNPIVVDKEKGEIRYMGYINGTYFTEGTRHAVVYEGGSNGDKTIVTGYGDEKEFYQACMDLGWTPGNNLTADNQKGGDMADYIEGDKLDVTIRWDGQDEEIPMWDCIEATNGDQREADWRFGGNLERAEAKNTGCVLCIDSCAVGICSNAAWPSGTTDSDKVTAFVGKSDVLPADGTDVIVTFRKA